MLSQPRQIGDFCFPLRMNNRCRISAIMIGGIFLSGDHALQPQHVGREVAAAVLSR